MQSGEDRDVDVYGRPLCHVCDKPIRAIERVPGPGGRAVHFYCFPLVRPKDGRGHDEA